MKADPDMVLAWDAPTRLFKWSLVVLVVLAPISKNFGDVMLVWHKVNGYAILTLLLWRLMWGFAGGTTARFTSFVRPIGAIGYGLDLLRGRTRHFLGHNPLGGLMVLALIAALLMQATLGLFTTDDIVVDGPFVSKVSSEAVKFASKWHQDGFKIILVLVTLHVAASLFYKFVKKDDLIRPMVTGVKPAGAYEDVPSARGGSTGLALGLLMLSAALVFGTVGIFGASPFK